MDTSKWDELLEDVLREAMMVPDDIPIDRSWELIDDLACNSMDVVEAVIEFEWAVLQRFGTLGSIPDPELSAWQESVSETDVTLGEFCDFLTTSSLAIRAERQM